MVRADCWYCGSPPKIEFNGIDRKDNTSGYTEGNCVPCCSTCNYMKKCLDHATFIKRCKHIAGDGVYEDAWPRASSIVPDGLCTFCNGRANGAPHCVECIRMRANTKLTPDEFIAKARAVSAHWPEPPESDRVCVRCIVKRTEV